LYEDSTIQWFEKQTDKKPEGTIRIKDIAQYLSVGPYTRAVPGRPSLPPRGDENLMICIPKDLGRKEKEILWILCKDINHLNDCNNKFEFKKNYQKTQIFLSFFKGMKAIVSTVI